MKRYALIIAIALIAHPAHAERGLASWYAQGHRTANGEYFNPDGLTAAHRTLPFGTVLCVSDPKSGRMVKVRVTDRGPFIKKRQIDLSRGAARALGMLGRGTMVVDIRPC